MEKDLQVEVEIEESENKTMVVSEESRVSQNDSVDIVRLTSEIKFYLGKMAQNVIEVGKRLIQAKTMLQHGEWLNWLEDNFAISYSTASRFMKCAVRFSRIAIPQNLNHSQMVELLSLPEAETEKFIDAKKSEGTPIEDMNIKKLREEVSKWKEKTKNKNSTTLEKTGEAGESDLNNELKQVTEQQREAQEEEMLQNLEKLFETVDFLLKCDNIRETFKAYYGNDSSAQDRIKNLKKLAKEL